MFEPRLRRNRLRPARIPAAVCLAGMALAVGCRSESPPKEEPTKTVPVRRDDTTKVDAAALRPKVQKFCGACHAVPQPSTFPRKAWYDEVAQGFRFYEQSNRSDLSPPPMNEVVAYYRQLAPERLALPQTSPETGPSKLRFEPQALAIPVTVSDVSVSHVRWRPKAAELLFCDMRNGDIRRVNRGKTRLMSRPIATLAHPAHIEPCDLDLDGRMDFLVAELGSFLPADHDRGAVVWLRALPDGGGFRTLRLATGLGRVADVRAADFDGDGDLDLLVAEFGWRTTGHILLLKQTGRDGNVPRFETVVLDNRHGTIHVPVVDLNGDGRPDFVALISQEHEAIEAFLNQGGGRFARKRIYQADDPSFGSSGIQLVDLDGDGDLDVLYTNGDSLDSFHLKPYHAVHWLENRGEYPFVHHELTRMPGVYRALAADLDGDGDLDVAAAAYLPSRVVSKLKGHWFDSLIWLEQRGKGRFVRHRLERGTTGHLAMEAGDFDGDGDLDLAVGNHAVQGQQDRAWLTIWWNRGMARSPVKRLVPSP